MRLLLLLILCFSFAAQALPKISVEKINGFEVHFVDIGVGNSIGVSFQVPFGTLHDYGRFLGRAHLLEHLMHVGTLRYPGYHAFDELLAPAGVASNASTSYSRTFYYAGAKDDQAELIIKVFLSMLGGLELSPEAVENERNVVINEIVEEGIPQQSTAFHQMPFSQLLPPSHPWNQALLGDRSSLKGLTKKDLQDLYDQVYRPGIVKIAVHGNFSRPEFLQQVRGWMSANVKASPLQNGKPLPKLTGEEKHRPELTLATRRIPSMFSDTSMAPESQKRLYVHSEDFDLGLILLEADSSKFPANSQAMGVLAKYLGSELPGSFIHKLKAKLGWITEGSIFQMEVRGRQLLYFSYTMSETGKSREQEINEIFFQGLKDAQETDVSQDFLERAKRMILHSTETAARSVPSFMEMYGGSLAEKKSFAQQISDVKSLSPLDLRSVALLFRPDQALYETSGPVIPEMDLDPVYQRKFKLYDNRRQLDRYVEIMSGPLTENFDPVVQAVDLGTAGSPSQPLFAQSKPNLDIRERFTVDVRHNLPDTAVALEFHLRPQSPSDMVALDLVLDAFNERLLGEETYVTSSYHVSLGTGRSADTFTLTASGEDSYSARALAWKLERLADFKPTGAELERAKNRYMNTRISDYVDAFSAQVVVTRGKTMIDPLDAGGMAALRAAASLSAEEITAAWKRLRERADRNLTAAGALNLDDLASVRAAGLRFSANSLTAEDMASLKERFTWNAGAVNETEQRFPKSKGEDAYAMVRFYKGPPASDLKAAAAFQALASLLSNQIYIYNRGEQQLGYVHNAAFKILDGENLFILMYGGTNGAENAAKTTAGWRHILDRIANGELGEVDIGAAISSVSNSLARQKTSARELVAQYSAGLSTHRDGRIAKAALSAAQSLTVEDVRESARKYLLTAGTAFTQLTLTGCEDLLTP